MEVLHALFEAQADRSPDAVAVVAGGTRLTYRELEARANRLARHLRSLGVGPESRVGICLERTEQLLVGVLGVLKAGGAYVPMDPSYPAERLAFLLEDSRVPVIVTQASLQGVLPEHAARPVLLDTHAPRIEGHGAERPQAGVLAQNLAYFIYTSGSTGRPKGVAIAHENAAALVRWALRVFPPEDLAGVLFATTLCFDLSVFEMFVPLAAGTRVIVAGNGLELPRLAAAREVTLVNTGPSVMAELVRERGVPPSVRVVNLAGEALPGPLVRAIYESTAVLKVFNLYGPSEDTTYSTGALIGRDEPGEPAIGKSIDGSQAWLLDESGRPVAPGETGEIYLGGAGLARGYFDRPDITAERFVPSPFPGRPGDRLYRTGDLARELPDGNLHFLGRADHQIKLRGLRIEPGEIEAALVRHPAVREAVVKAWGKGEAARLAAYVAAEAPAPAASELRGLLLSTLPSYMVPAEWVFLDALPRTLNGKVDRKALAEPERKERPAVGYVAPRTPVEQALAGYWAEALGEPAGLHESFFEAGGSSLLATRILARIYDAFGVDLPLRAIFAAPTIAGLAGLVETVAARGRGTEAEGARLARIDREGILPLAPVQQGLWLLDRLMPGGPLYNIPCVVLLRGPLVPGALAGAISAVVRRHEALRTSFPEAEGSPRQEIRLPSPVALPLVDLSALRGMAAGAEEELRRLALLLARQGFDLRRGPLLRTVLIRLGLPPDAPEHALSLTVHHIVFDGWSEGVFWREVSALYAAALEGRPDPLPELPLQYADYAAWRLRRDQETERDELDWWLRYLRGIETLELPTDRPRPALPVSQALPAFRGAMRRWVFPQATAAAVGALARATGVTPFMALLAALSALLSRYGGQDRFAVGAPFSGRGLSALEGLIGYFVHPLALRADLSGRPAFRELLERTRESVLAASAHQELAFDRLVKELNPERDPVRNPVFQVVFEVANEARPLPALPGVEAAEHDLHSGTAKFDLDFGLEEHDGLLLAGCEYSTDLFDAATVDRLCGHFVRLAAAAAAAPGVPVAELPLLSEAEVRSILEHAGAPAALGSLTAVHRLFEVQARRAPEAVAVLTAAGGRLTYGELDRASGRLARFLAGRGVGPEVPVGVCLERSPELVIALLGVLKAGGVYLPLDPAYPADRLAFMLEDSGAPLVLASSRSLQALPADGPEAVALDAPEGPLSGEADAAGGAEEPASCVLPESLAYLIYTSGSTGRPKGVGVAHGPAAAHLETVARLIGLREGERFLQFSSPSFDMSLEEILAPLVSGATVVLREGELWQPAAFLERVAELGVTVVNVPTAYWHAWAAESERAVLPAGLALRLVFLGGEAMSGEAARRWRRSPLGGLRLLNGYGPTEAVITATVFEVDANIAGAAAGAAAGAVPIGLPLAGRTALVLDRDGQLLPEGAAGELCLGGPLLARGYAGRPDVTAERFLPDPFSGEPGARLYRTGDRVRRRPDGVLEFLGRIDRQVKVRGFRVEPGEVEAALARHPAVRAAVVDARPDGAGGRRLVAWILPASPAEPPAAARLRESLLGTLPEHMVPAAFVILAELPLTPNGKVDYRALPEPQADAGEPAETYVAPRTPTEETLARIWAEALGFERVGVHDSFFALGGHSLLGVRVLARIQSLLGAEVPLSMLLAAPTVDALARAVEAARREPERSGPALGRVSRDGPLPLSPAQQGLWFLDRLEPGQPAYTLAGAVVLRGALDAAALEAAFCALTRRHEALRTRFPEADGEPRQEILPPSAFVLPRIDLSALPAAVRASELERRWRAEARRPFDLARGPLLRAVLVCLSPGEHVLLVTVHHIVSDGWSEAVLWEDLSAAYAAARAGRPATLPELPLQYADYAVWQLRRLEETFAGEVGWWRRQLEGIGPLELPTDRPRPAARTWRGVARPLVLPEPLTAGVRELAVRQGATPFMTLLAAYAALLSRYSGQELFAVGAPVAGRATSELDDLIGMFVNLLALRADLGGRPTFRGLVERTRETLIATLAHQNLPFGRLVQELNPVRDLSRNPVFQVSFQVFDQARTLPALPGIEASAPDFHTGTARFDLELELEDHGAELRGGCEYSADLFDAGTIDRLLGHFNVLLAAAVAAPERELAGLPLLSPAERHQVVDEWNDTASPFPAATLMHQFFEAAADRDPAAPAAVWEGRELTYAGLEERANRIAHLLRERGVGRGTPVGVWMERSLDMVAGVLAVLKAGGYYVPLDPAWPADRVEAILRETGAPAVLTREAHLGRVLEMRWRLPVLAAVICLDVEEPEPAPEPVDTESVRAVFDLLSERSVDRITAGGFVSSFTGLPFSAAEVDEYRDRVLGLAAPWIGPDRRVLEIGSGSGLLLWEIAPRVARCVGLDPSPLTQERNRARAAELGLPGDTVELPVGFAHEIEGWAEGSFDLVLIASTAQFFPGPLYLEKVVKLARRVLAPGGALVIADVPDARRQEELRTAIEKHRGQPARQDSHKILSMDEDFFRDLGAAVFHRETGFANELRFRYDVVLTHPRERRKELLTSWHVDRCPAERLPAVAAPEDLAYVIHTSGSTGQPKGIVVQHRPVANLIAWINPALGIGPSDRVLFVTSLCFDLSVWDVFGMLAAGGCVHVASEEDLQDAERLMRILLEEPVTVWDSAPAALARLAPLFPSAPAVQSRLRRVMLSGDWIPVTLPDRVRAAFPQAEVTALGGATEATVWSNSYPIGEVDPDRPSIPYGRPMPNAQYRVLDAELSPCPAGVPGDLYIGGDCLCVGYAHQPDLTAAAFVPDPFGGPGSRLYRTGDRARHFTDGNLEFLGRVDQQVKIRGFRIELGEIEVALARHAGVREAVVLAREDAPGDKRLVAYVVPAAGGLPDLRGFLRRSLPEYMIPAAFVELEALPVTPNGKLDRRALPAPRWDRGAVDEGMAPSTPTEQALANLWREILGVEHVGVHDSFFDLGGHSLLASRLVARIRESFQVDMALRTVFQVPALGELAAILDEAAPRRTFRESAIRPIPPAQRTGLLPLSFPQQRLWLVESLATDGSAYHIPYAFRLRGPLDAEALASALGALAERHEVLRTRFVERDGRPWQEILPPAPFALRPEEVSAEDLERLVREEAAWPFDLASAPPFRARLLRLDAEDHALLLTMHHIASDGWSEPILIDELSALYQAAETGVPARLLGLPIQYADYAAWQRAWPEELLAGRLSYWTRQLAGTTTLELPTDRPRPPVETFRGARVPVAVPPAVAVRLRGLARQRNATLFMLLLAAWQAVLHRITGQDDVIVGSPMANREQPEVRGLIGFFVNMLPLRADLGGNPTFAELLDQVRRVALEGYDHADVPFERLVEELGRLGLERDLSRHPVFQVLFTMGDAEPLLPRFPGVEAAWLSPPSEIAKLDLGLSLADLLTDRDDEGFGGEIEYNTDLFDRATVERLAGHLGRFLAAVAADGADGDARVSEIDLLGPEERERLFAWSGTPVPEPRPDLLHEAFAARAAREPGRPALVWGERRLTYGELDERSDRLAARLRALGVGPEVRVGLCSARTPDLVTGVLGILKAGGAYVPLDPEYPRERLAFTLEDARVPVLVTRESLLPILPEHDARVVLLDGPEMEVPARRPPALAVADNLAYLIYTSGSTGRSKGVAIAHRSAVEMVRWASGVFPAEDLAGVLASTSICFDLSVFEIFLPLSRGGAVILATNALELPLLPAAGEVTLINTVPSAMAELVRTGGVPSSVRTVNLAGEALPGTLVDEIHRSTSARVMNLYGPSEDTTYSTFAEIRPGTDVPPIGRPIDGTRAWILDRFGLPVPPCVPGDLHLGGAGLARGYLERPELTAERFVPDAWSGEAGGRLYRTGDLVRWLPDGMLRFLGRVDHQVKVRGFRIELGEIEAVLGRHPSVREAVVSVRGESLGDRHLVAWVTPREERPSPHGLREFLLSRLPGPAVPTAFVVLDELPRTPNGKVDRRALPDLETGTERSAPYAAPSTPTGEALAAIWSGLLGVERVGRVGAHDSFFELGGHSLLASQLVSRVREAFGAELPLRAVFQSPTLDALAAAVAAAARSSSPSPPSGPVPRSREMTELPLSASQLRQWFLVQLEPDSVDFNLPITVRLEGDLDAAALTAALRALVRRHEALRTTFVSVGGRPVALVAPETDLPLPVLSFSSTPEAERAAVADSDRPFDLARGPLMRALLIHLSEREHLLALTFHHIVFDGFSTAVLLRDLAALYEAEVSGRPADLPALPVQYADYAAWQQEQLRSPGMRAKIERWKERLAGASQVLDLPTDRPRPAVQSPHGEMLPVTVPAAEAGEVRKLAAREGATLFMALLAGYAALLSRYTGEENLNVGTFVANRPLPALERLIGFFVNTLVLRVDLSGNPPFRELLARVREMALDAFENQEVPFESLLDELETGRDLSRGPLFQVMFGVENFALPTVEIPGLSLRPVSLSQHARTNGDLAFWIGEEEDGTLESLLQLSSDLFDASTVVCMFRHMERLLAAGAADPGLRLSELPLLSAAETGQILVEWNRPGEKEPEPDALLHERFERWAALQPGAVALETADGKEVLTYGELNRRGNRLAHRLRRLGVRTDSIVGIWAERGVEFVVGVLGTLKAGGAYMPLDPSLPADRLAAIVRGSGIPVLLARDGRPPGLPAFEGEVVILRGLAPASPASDEDDVDPAPLAVPGSLVYVLFTSGSTGTPKGVLIHHAALANFAETTRRLYGVGPGDRILQFSSLVFDISVEEIFTAWAAGATLVLRDEEMVSSPARFLRACGELDVQMVDLPTAYWHELGVELAKGEAALPICVRSVVFAGERALLERMAGWQEAIGRGVRLFNSYGPTEATPASSVFDPAGTVAGASTNGLSIGRPMRGARLYVVDFDLRPVPVGVAGELLIAGASLGRGYAGRADLTAERFLPDPFARVPGERVYRTGDRVRWLRDGNLELIGRMDDQVKIRGFRVEPGEIAAVLCRHPGVREAVVVPREAGNAGLSLVAYAAADPGTAVAELRSLVKAALPAYMVPADFVLLEALPLTATGKLDRRALPEPSVGAEDDGHAPPETMAEELLAGIWSDLLGRERVGIYDNFFDLGGHSLLAPQVFARIEETFRLELPLRALFEAPTVAQLAGVIEQELLAQIEELSDEEAESLVLSDEEDE